MKKAVSLLCAIAFLFLLTASAYASPIGRVLPEADIELHALVGKSPAEYEALLAQHGQTDPSGVRVLESSGVIKGFILSASGFSLYDCAVGSPQPNALTEQMEANGWITTQDQFEGGLRFYTFEKTMEDAVYTFRLHSCDWQVTSVSLWRELLTVSNEEQVAQAKALFSEGYAYERGRNVDQDYVKAMECYQQAYLLGNGAACTRIALLYRSGEGVEQNYEEAIRWLQLGHDMGDPEGMYYLAEMYMNGQGVERSYETAIYWYEYAARQGSSKAQYMAALLYYEGRFVEQDWAKARELLELATEPKLSGIVKLLEELDAAEGK